MRRAFEKDIFGRNLRDPRDSRRKGKALRDKVPRESHAQWIASVRPEDPIEILIASNAGRQPELLPLRHQRMLASPFTFLRGTAAIMASDLALTPATGLRVQACGDCHCMNFGAFGTAERRINFDINDFDETLPAPWEWDVKRLATSLVLAGRDIGLKERDGLAAAKSTVRSYRRQTARYADMRALDLWYDRIDVEQLLKAMPTASQNRLSTGIEKARSHAIIEHCFPKLVERSGARPRIKDDWPLIFHEKGQRAGRNYATRALDLYCRTLDEDHRLLLERFRLCDLARKVAGVGSVGTICMVMLLMAGAHDPLFIQMKQANRSVLAPYAGKSAYANHAQRIVMGQRMMQAAGDMMLSWTAGKLDGHYFYLRQLHDMKFSPELDLMSAQDLGSYAKLCGWALARAHARTGDPAMIAGYLGNSDAFDQAVVKFAKSYADQIEGDFKAAQEAARIGRIKLPRNGF